MTDRPRIAVVDDEEKVRDLLSVVLADAGMDARAVADGAACLDLVNSWSPDLVLLDHKFPEGSPTGLDICRQIRRDPDSQNLPVIVLTGDVDAELEERFFDAGADDYIRKSAFRAKLFVSRINAVLRRTRQTGAEIVQTEHLTIHPGRREALIDGEAVNLTPTEFDILHKLALNPDRALTRRELLDRGGKDGDGVDRTVDVHVLSIRRKLRKHAWLVSTVWGVGYRLGTSPG